MFDWFLGLPLIGQVWLTYAVGAVVLLGLATYIEFTRSRHVDGAGGWMFFGAMILSFWGLVLSALASLVILAVRWLG